jgi:hypothetical protein
VVENRSGALPQRAHDRVFLSLIMDMDLLSLYFLFLSPYFNRALDLASGMFCTSLLFWIPFHCYRSLVFMSFFLLPNVYNLAHHLGRFFCHRIYLYSIFHVIVTAEPCIVIDDLDHSVNSKIQTRRGKNYRLAQIA